MFAHESLAKQRLLTVAVSLVVLLAALWAAVPAHAEFGITSVSNEVLNAAGEPDTRAGAHPYELVTKIGFPQMIITRGGEEGLVPDGNLKTLRVDLPTGFVGDPRSMPQCSDELLDVAACPRDTQVGIVEVAIAKGSAFVYGAIVVPLYNMKARPDEPAQFGFVPGLFPVRSHVSIRTDSDYGISYELQEVPQPVAVLGTKVTLWGVPGDESHDSERGQLCNNLFLLNGTTPIQHECIQVSGGAGQVDVPHKPFLTNPTSCEGKPLVTKVTAASWQDPHALFSASAESAPTTSCEELEFEPKLKARPTTNVTDAPSGLDVNLEVPQHEDFGGDGRATPHLRNAVVTLPEGLVVNPSSANGLEACTPAQIGLTTPVGNPHATFDKEKPSCPDGASIGLVETDVPAFDESLTGKVFLAAPHQNPFGSLLSLYLVIEGHGLVIKLAGKVSADPVTGRLTTSFEENPQTPVEALRLKLFSGATAPLRTPATCGNYTTTSSLTPWSAPDSGPPATPSDTYAIDHGANGGACASGEAQLPNTPSFDAGSVSPIAGAYKPFVVNLKREDGTQQFAAVTVTPPPGLVAKLKGTATCSDAALASAASKSGNTEKSSPSCPASSAVGSVHAQAGAGPAPYNAPGKVYLAGPYKGAPLSLATVIPATAGPFDLGTVVTRVALAIDPTTAQVTATSDPLPQILQGIPLDIRSVSLRLDKPDFSLNPTSCDPMAVKGTLLSTTGAGAALDNRFQLAECGRLKFKPSLAFSLKGKTTRSGHPALTAVLKPRAGDANIASVSVALPHSEFLAQNHIRTVCTRVQFAADQCPKGSIYGKVSVTTPILDAPLTGPVYLRSSSNPLPDLVVDLHGPPSQPIRFEASGRIDSVNGGIRNTFDIVPDVPFTKLTLQLQGAKKGLLENSRDICAFTNRAAVTYTAHNGASYSIAPELKAKGCGAKGRKGGKGKGGGKKKGSRHH